jgi:hypothetical protein
MCSRIENQEKQSVVDWEEKKQLKQSMVETIQQI